MIASAIPCPDPPLSGTTFLLRTFVRGDFDAAARFASDPATASSVPPLPASDATGVLEFFEQYRHTGELLHLVIADREDDSYLGEVMLAVGEGRVGELGIGVVPGARSRGMATEAFCTFAHWVARTLDLGRLQVLVAPENAGALRVAEHAGFTREGLLRSYWERDGERVDAVILSLIPGTKAPASE